MKRKPPTRETKFRQRNSNGGWHYWGFIDGQFVRPLSTLGLEDSESYQFTGLQDKNGKDIYTRDILKEYGRTGYTINLVVFPEDHDSWGWGVDYAQSYDYDDMPVDGRFSRYLPLNWINETSEVIGSELEHPALLERKTAHQPIR